MMLFAIVKEGLSKVMTVVNRLKMVTTVVNMVKDGDNSCEHGQGRVKESDDSCEHQMTTYTSFVGATVHFSTV